MNLQATMTLHQKIIDSFNELAPDFLDFYVSCGKRGTMVVTSRTGIISVIYKGW